MKTMEKQSFLQKLIHRIKNSSLYYMINSPDVEVTSSEEIDTEEKISKLAESTNTSAEEIWRIERAFNESENSLYGIEEEMLRIPEDEKDSSNPFKVPKDSLKQTKNSISKETKENIEKKAQPEKGRERDF